MRGENKGKGATVTGWVAEMSKGQYLHINATDDGDGTWFDFTPSVFQAYCMNTRKDLKNICDFEFSDYPKGYPKYHKVRFSYEFV